MKKATALLYGTILWLGTAAPCQGFGSGDRGTAGAQFLKIGPGARPAGMGEAFSAVADDVHAIYYNPAGLAALKSVEVTGMHNEHFQDVDYEFAAVAVPLLRWTSTRKDSNAYGVLGFSVTNLSVGRIERRGLTETDTPDSSFGANDFAYSLAYAYAFPYTGLSLGGAAKYVESDIDTVHAGAVAADLGALYRMDLMALSFGVRHLGTEQRFSHMSDPLPTTMFAGASYRFSPKLMGALEATVPRDGNPRLAAGGEYRHAFNKEVRGAVRAGYTSPISRSTTAGGLYGGTFGLGMGFGRFSFDFAWLPFGDLGNSFRYSLHVKF